MWRPAASRAIRTLIYGLLNFCRPMVAEEGYHSGTCAWPCRSRRKRRHNEILTEDLRPGCFVKELHDTVSDRGSEEIGLVEHERPVVVIREVAHLEDHRGRVCGDSVLEPTPTVRVVPAHRRSAVGRVVVKTRRRAKRILDVVQQRIPVRFASRSVRHLASTIPSGAAAIRV